MPVRSHISIVSAASKLRVVAVEAFVRVPQRATLPPALAQPRVLGGSKNIDGCGAEGQLREYLRPVHELPQRGWTQALFGNDDRVARIQTELLESIAPVPGKRCAANYRSVGTNHEGPAPVRVAIRSAGQSQIAGRRSTALVEK